MLNDAQLAVLATAIANETDPAFVALRDAGATGQMAEWFNQDSTVYVWRMNIDADEYRKAFVWNEVDKLTIDKARIIEWMTGSLTLPIDPSNANIRAGFADAFAANTTTRANLIAMSKRLASRGEALFATGVGTEQNPADPSIEGRITNSHIIAALQV